LLGYKAHIPGIYSSNIHGISYTKSTALAIKGDYSKNIDIPSDERYTTTTKKYFQKPVVREDSKVNLTLAEMDIKKENPIKDPASMTLDTSTV
jgi:hypothetical protein